MTVPGSSRARRAASALTVLAVLCAGTASGADPAPGALAGLRLFFNAEQRRAAGPAVPPPAQRSRDAPSREATSAKRAAPDSSGRATLRGRRGVQRIVAGVPDRAIVPDRAMVPDRAIVSDRSWAPDRSMTPDRSITP